MIELTFAQALILLMVFSMASSLVEMGFNSVPEPWRLRVSVLAVAVWLGALIAALAGWLP